MKRVLLILSSLALCVVLFYYLSGDRESGPKLRLGSSSYMEEVNISQKRDGKVSWELAAKRADFLTRKDVRLTEPRISFPERNLELTSESATYDMEKKDFKIEGSVTAWTKDFRFVAPELFWDGAANQLTTDGKVTITGGKFSIEGEGLRASHDKATLQNRVRAVFDGS
jgi:LPS export ABC transporter protein LptC